MSVPLVAHGSVLGAITFVSSRAPEAFGPIDVECAELLASRCAMAVEGSRLVREAAGALEALSRVRREHAMERARRRCDLRRRDLLSWKGPRRG
jgi:GAF domain-containing protein